MSLRHSPHRCSGLEAAAGRPGRDPSSWRWTALVCSVIVGATVLPGCQALFLGGAALGGALIATDRRTSASQLEDQSIEFKARSRIKAAIGERGHISVTSYNRVALLTGEAWNAADRTAVEQAITHIEGVKSVVNEVVEMPNSSLGSRSNDAILSGKVKATLFDAKGTLSNAYKVVVERNVVYLMGRVTDSEAGQIAELASSVPGVEKVVRVFEVLSDEDMKALHNR